jgi:glycopeptide antibiotics resistance protein
VTSVSRRTTLLFAAMLFLGFAAYGSVVPLHLRAISFKDAIASFLLTRFIPIGFSSGTDFVTNVLLFVPIGFCTLGAAAPWDRTRASAWFLPVVVLAFAASVGIEFSQVFVEGRTASWNDVLAESFGAILGGAAWIAIGPLAVTWFGDILQLDSRRERLLRLLSAYVLVWGILGILPLDFTIRPQELAEKFRAGRIVLLPFADHPSLENLLTTFLLATPIGAFGVVLARARRLEPVKVWALALGLGAVGLVEGAQLFLVSRTADTTDVIVGACGVLAGAWVALRGEANLSQTARPSGRVRLWPVAALAVWIVVLLARHWSPFDFRADGGFIRQRLPLLFRIPFYGYYWGNPLNALAEASTKVLLGVPVGALLQWVYVPVSRGGRALQACAIVLVSLALFTTVELGQVLLPSRFPDQTDIYLGTAGACVGLLAIRLVTRRAESSAPAASSVRA